MRDAEADRKEAEAAAAITAAVSPTGSAATPAFPLVSPRGSLIAEQLSSSSIDVIERQAQMEVLAVIKAVTDKINNVGRYECMSV